MIQELIAKWQEKHSKLLSEYESYSYSMLSKKEALFLRSEMRQVVEIIEDLQKLKTALENTNSSNVLVYGSPLSGSSGNNISSSVFVNGLPLSGFGGKNMNH